MIEDPLGSTLEWNFKIQDLQDFPENRSANIQDSQDPTTVQKIRIQEPRDDRHNNKYLGSPGSQDPQDETKIGILDP